MVAPRAWRLSLALLLCLPGCGASPSAFSRATSMAREHREADALRVLREHLAADPADVRSRRLLIRVLATTGDLGAARREVETLSRQLGENDPLPYIELGHAYELAHSYDKALEMYDHAAEVAPADPRGPREGGMRAARWGEAEWALPRLEEAAKRGADDADLWHALGLVRVHAGELDRASEAYRRGLKVDPAALDCHLGLATVAAIRGEATVALVEYDAIVTRRPSWAPGHIGRAWALARLGRKEEARTALAQAEHLGGPSTSIAAQRRALGD
ncbi:MAG TPA: tetratricopeptide repeat protein [Polyangiaceae bacterium]|nr:tetratricopeptide repeat protein [Polyangiaceae bacterium]